MHSGADGQPMTDKSDTRNKIYLMLQSNGYIVLNDDVDCDVNEDGCETPLPDPSIDLTPVSIGKLTELVRERFLDNPDENFPEKLKVLLAELQTSVKIVESTITEIENKLK